MPVSGGDLCFFRGSFLYICSSFLFIRYLFFHGVVFLLSFQCFVSVCSFLVTINLYSRSIKNPIGCFPKSLQVSQATTKFMLSSTQLSSSWHLRAWQHVAGSKAYINRCLRRHFCHGQIRKHWGVVHHHPWDSDGFCRSWVYDGICKSLQIPVKDYEHGQLLNTSSCSTWPTAPCTPMPWHTAHPSIESPYRRAAQHQVNCSRAGDWHLLSAVHHVHPLHSSGMNMMNF